MFPELRIDHGVAAELPDEAEDGIEAIALFRRDGLVAIAIFAGELFKVLGIFAPDDEGL